LFRGGGRTMARQKNQDPEGVKTICRNKRAYHEYEILEALECGLVLTGTEVKSLREGSASLENAYAKVDGAEVGRVGSHTPAYTMGSRMTHKPKWPRSLLLHRR